MNMYINDDLCLYQLKKDINKCDRIFRPWDNHTNKNLEERDAQDSTVSTTTQEGEYKLGEKCGNLDSENINRTKNKCRPTTETESVPLVTSSAPPKDKVSVDNQKTHDDCLSSKFNNYQNQVLNGYRHKQTSNDSLLQTSSVYAVSCENIIGNPEMLVQGNQFSIDYLQDPSLFSTDLMQANLAHQLGLPPNDPLLMESLAQGYALEEYARVLNQEQQAKLLAAKKQRPKKYRCPHCDVGFSNNGQLKGHIRIHTGERPFKCDEKDCGKTFTRNEELTRHKRIHSGLRPFPCSHCGKRFGRKDHLKKHSRTHFQPRGLYAVPVVLPFEAWASGHTKGYPFFPVIY